MDEADLLLHVIDITHPKAPEQAEVVEQTLNDLDLGGKPRLLVINKMDLLTDTTRRTWKASTKSTCPSSPLPTRRP